MSVQVFPYAGSCALAPVTRSHIVQLKIDLTRQTAITKSPSPAPRHSSNLTKLAVLFNASRRSLVAMVGSPSSTKRKLSAPVSPPPLRRKVQVQSGTTSKVNCFMAKYRS